MSRYSLFSVLGIEIEYMLVDPITLNIMPISDQLLKQLAGHQVNEYKMGKMALSNELVLHVLELKNHQPQPPGSALVKEFQDTIISLQPALAAQNTCLLPGGAHPWMNPLTETKRWTHDNQEIYRQFDTIFNCEGHGWANLQSMHLNLPFANDEEFNRLHNAIRLMLPLIPALAASTPILEGKITGKVDSRLFYYGGNQKKIPCIAGQIIPEFIQSMADYQSQILEPMYEAIRPYDPDGILQFQWLNSRGAIAKFDVNAIEIRVIDSQECVQADIAIALAIFYILQDWVNHSAYYLDNPYPTEGLKILYDQCINQGFPTQVEDSKLLEQWQLPKRTMNLTEIWSYLIEKISTKLDQPAQLHLETILSQGNLSQRILKACGPQSNPGRIKQVYEQLAEGLLKNQSFRP